MAPSSVSESSDSAVPVATTFSAGTRELEFLLTRTRDFFFGALARFSRCLSSYAAMSRKARSMMLESRGAGQAAHMVPAGGGPAGAADEDEAAGMVSSRGGAARAADDDELDDDELEGVTSGVVAGVNALRDCDLVTIHGSSSESESMMSTTAAGGVIIKGRALAFKRASSFQKTGP